jgi:hypothetical protein
MTFAVAWDKNVPPADTELGKITSIQDYRTAAAQLQRFAEGRLDDRAALRSEFEKAGFEHSSFKDGPDGQCEAYQFERHDTFPSVYRVTVCDGKVLADAGQQAP